MFGNKVIFELEAARPAELKTLEAANKQLRKETDSLRQTLAELGDYLEKKKEMAEEVNALREANTNLTIIRDDLKPVDKLMKEVLVAAK